MELYSEQEKKDAASITEINKTMLKEKSRWDDIFDELKVIYSRIPYYYLNDFQQDGKLYYKFWDKEEYINRCKQETEEQEIIWIENAYPRCCYYLTIISIERGEFDAAAKFLEKGIDLELDNPLLLSELGLLFCNLGAAHGNTDFYDKALGCYNQAFNSRPYNTHTQKALALRGIGFVLIELEKFEEAKKIYEASLTWEESDNARCQLKIIDQQLNNVHMKIFGAVSNLNKAKDIGSIAYLFESLNKLPKALQEKFPKKYVYIWSKACSLLRKGGAEYRKNDFFHYPLPEWNESEMTQCLNQIVHFLKGFEKSHYLEADNLRSALNLLLTFHFEAVAKNQINSNKNQKLLEIRFRHKVDSSEIVLYFAINQYE